MLLSNSILAGGRPPVRAFALSTLSMQTTPSHSAMRPGHFAVIAKSYHSRQHQVNTATTPLSVRTRRLHTSSNRSAPPAAADSLPVTATPGLESLSATAPMNMMAKSSPLSVLPLPTILRTLATSTISSSPLLLPPSLAAMTLLAHSHHPVLNPERNPLLRWFLKKTFYAQFCAGENAAEVRRTVDGLKKIGFHGVILGYAKEVVLSESQARDLSSCTQGPEAEACVRNEILPWKAGTMETVRLARPGDFVALKFTGAGRQALYALKNNLPPPPSLAAAIDEVCALAAERDIPLLFDAEQTALQPGIDAWTLDYQRRFNKNRDTKGHAIIYGTYQAYLKSTPATLSRHLAAAEREGFTLGVKLVRGAYLGSDPRHVIHDTKADTDAAYDDMASGLVRRRWGGNNLRVPEEAGGGGGGSASSRSFPQVSVVLGSHNLESVRRARAVRESPEAASGMELAIAQLQGMADEVSCDLLCAIREAREKLVQQQQGQKKISSSESDGIAATASTGTASTTNTNTASSSSFSPSLSSLSSSASFKGVSSSTAAASMTRAHKYLVWGSTKECMAYLLRRANENKDAVGRTRAGRDAMWEELKRRMRVSLLGGGGAGRA